MSTEAEQVPGFLFFDHVAISVKPGELEARTNPPSRSARLRIGERLAAAPDPSLLSRTQL